MFPDRQTEHIAPYFVSSLLLDLSQVPLLVGTAVLNGVRHVRHNRREQDTALGAEDGASEEQVVLEWRQLDCVLVDKKGGRKEILKSLQGCARPGRCAKEAVVYFVSPAT